MNISKNDITQIANSVGLDYPRLMAFISVESGGKGFNDDGKIVIQFEPTWFHKYLDHFKIPHTYSSVLNTDGKKEYVIQAGDKRIQNGVQGQLAEWNSFNTAFAIHPESAMLATSIGLMQVMGFNFSDCGYPSVNAMYDSFKKGEYQQIQGGANFIKSNAGLYQALRNKDWAKVAYYYNGPNYAINKYDTKLEAAYKKYSV